MLDSNEKTTLSYWDSVWKKQSGMDNFFPTSKALGNFVEHQFHNFFLQILNKKADCSLLEIGCAASTWLPYFSQQFALKISGLDRSFVGCQKAESILIKKNITGAVYHADLFDPPAELLGKFDILISFGVIEHFVETAACLTACSRFLRPAGLMITIIPNLSGWMGALQKKLDCKIYDCHVPLTRENLLHCHGKANLTVDYCDYFLFLNLGVLNYLQLRKRLPGIWPAIWRLRALIDRLAWLAEAKFPSLCRSNSKTSPYIICVAKTKSDNH